MHKISNILTIASLLGSASSRKATSTPELSPIQCKPDTLGITRSVVDEKTGIIFKQNSNLPVMKCSDSISIPTEKTEETINYLSKNLIKETNKDEGSV